MTEGSYTYDAAGQRVKKVSTAGTAYYAYSSTGPLMWKFNPTTGVGTNYIYLAGKLVAMSEGAAGAPKQVTYYYTDLQGSTLGTTNTAGQFINTADRKPYGGYFIGRGVGDVGFVGNIQDDESGLDYFRARYYDADVGRFASVDPVAVAPSNLANFNRYAYGNDSPIVNADPLGRCVGSRGGEDAPCNHIPDAQPPPSREVSPEVQRMRDVSDNGMRTTTQPVAASSGFAFSGFLVGTPSVSATGMAAFGGGGEVVKGIYKSNDSLSIVTPAVGLTASADVKLLEITYSAGNVSAGPIRIGGGGEVSFHELLGGRLSFGYEPPATFHLELDGGLGLGVGFHALSVGAEINR